MENCLLNSRKTKLTPWKDSLAHQFRRQPADVQQSLLENHTKSKCFLRFKSFLYNFFPSIPQLYFLTIKTFFETRCSWLKIGPSSVMFGIFRRSLTTTPGAKVKDHSSCESRAETQRCQRSLERKTHGVELPTSFTRLVRKCTNLWNSQFRLWL